MCKLSAVVPATVYAREQRARLSGFTLIEILVVIAIIAILAAILFPVMTEARQKARQSNCTSNLRQLGLGVQMYAEEQRGYPGASSPATTVPRTRWVDHIYPYVKNERVYLCPSMRRPDVLSKKFARNQNAKYGGYGYNFQYLGNSRVAPPNLPFTATDSAVRMPTKTVAIVDTNGALNTDGTFSGEGTYVVDPPLSSNRGSGNASGYYASSSFANGGRSMPAERHGGFVNVAFADGHAKSMRLSELDDLNSDGVVDNGYWNGLANPYWR